MNKVYNFIYLTTNKVNGKKYLGKHSTNKLNDKYLGCGVYEWSKSTKGNKGFKGAVNKYGIENFKMQILMYFDNSDLAYRAEKLLGYLWKVKDNSCFYNISDCGKGGGHSTGHKLSEESINKMKITKKKNRELGLYLETWNKGKVGVMPEPWNKGTKGVMKAWNKNKKMNNPPWNKGVRMREESILKSKLSNNKIKRVYQFDVNADFVKEWFSCEEAVNYGFKGVASCCKHKTNSCKGFIWIYKDEYLNNENIFKEKLSKLNIINGEIRAWNANKKDVYSEKTKELWTKQRKGVKLSEETKEKIRNSVSKGMTNEIKNKISAGMKESSKKRKVVICPHCDKEGISNNIIRWHFNNCKFKNNDNPIN